MKRGEVPKASKHTRFREARGNAMIPPEICSPWPEPILKELIAELNDETVTAIILHGSYARGTATPPYSDVDLVRILYETPERRQQKRFIWWQGSLLNLSSRPLSIYREWLTQPQEALFRISTIRNACILLDKEGTFRAFQQQTLRDWRWEPLQPAADAYASQMLVELSEVILRTLGAIRYQKEVMITERILLHILPDLTKALAVQKGVLAGDGSYLLRVQETVGLQSAWTQWYMQAAGVAPQREPLSLEQRARAALRLYQETVRLLRPCLLEEHRETITTLLHLVDAFLEEKIS